MRRLILLFSLLILAVTAFAQKNDIALTGGGYIEATDPLNLGLAPSLEGSYARQIARVPLLQVSVEIPVAGSFSSSIPTLSGLSIASSYTSLFVTPGVRLRLAPSFFLSPYVAAGVGYGQFNKTLMSGGTSTDGAMAFDVAGGLDMKILPHISLRGEIRDFNSGGLNLPSVLSTIATGRQNNLFVTAGVAVRF